MSEQRPALTVMIIVFMGMIGLAIMLVLMMFPLQDLQDTPTGTRVKLANAVSVKFKPEQVTADFKDGPGFQILAVDYTTRARVTRDEADDEMRRMAEFVRDEMAQYKDDPIVRTRRIAIKRTELYGSGCFQHQYENEFALEVPERKIEKPSRPLPRNP